MLFASLSPIIGTRPPGLLGQFADRLRSRACQEGAKKEIEKIPSPAVASVTPKPPSLLLRARTHHKQVPSSTPAWPTHPSLSALGRWAIPRAARQYRPIAAPLRRYCMAVCGGCLAGGRGCVYGGITIGIGRITFSCFGALVPKNFLRCLREGAGKFAQSRCMEEIGDIEEC